MAVVFFLYPFLISYIGAEHYGLYVLLISLSGFLGVLNIGLGEATLRYAAFYYGKRDFTQINNVVGATLSVYLAMASLAAIVLFSGADVWVRIFKMTAADQDLAATLLRWTALAFWLRFLSGPYGAIPQALMRFDLAAQVLVGESILRVIGSIAVILGGYGLLGLIIWNTILSAFVLFANIAVSKSLLPKLTVWPRISRKAFQEIFSYGIYAFISQIFGLAWQYGDRMILGILIGTSAVAFYSIPQDLSFRILGLAAAAGMVLMPKFSSIQSEEAMKDLFLRSTSILLVVTIILFVPISTLIQDFIRLWVSPDFAEASGWVAVLIATSCLVRGAFLPYESLFKGIGKPQYYLLLIILTSATIIAIDLILIPIYGLAGAGYSLCISPIWGFASIVFVWRVIFKERSLLPLVKVLLLPICIGGGCLVLSIVLGNQFPPVIGWFHLGFLGTVIMLFTGFSLFVYERFNTAEIYPIRQVYCLFRDALGLWKIIR